jgi:glutathione-specific gamma-glutamylcyclotransferase
VAPPVFDWIFGYGSLVWRPAFPALEQRPARVRGWTRRFWQGSTDHRGVPSAPGRVVTLVPEPDAVCWGMAYRVEPTRLPEVLDALDVREQGGYARHEVALELLDPGDGAAPVRGLMYVAGPGNPNYLGPAPLDAIAAQVRRSTGPSGANLEYVLRLAAALREMGADDAHVFELAELLAAAER